MALGISTTVRNNRLTQILNAIDAGPAAGTVKIYDGARPATGGSTTTLIATLTLSKPSWTVSGGTMTLNAVTSGTAVAGSTATWARFADSTGTFVVDCAVGTSGSDINLSSVVISLGQTVSITSGSATEGDA